MANESEPNWGVVVIGRNEGERLKTCLASALQRGCTVVYVDSGSTDGSADWARSQGVAVVDLDLSRPFTAARARNEGFARLQSLTPHVELVQFVDGDCELQPRWLESAAVFLTQRSDVAAVCGRRRERFPLASIFNAQCDREWNTPIGEAKACGGDAMIRVSAFNDVKGFRTDLIAGEEPELCVRLRAARWKIWRLDLEMTLHDAAMQHWRQWWKRAVRTGHAYAQGAWLHGAAPERHWVAETRRAVLWGFAIPTLILGGFILIHPLFLWGLVLYPLQTLRIAARSKEMNRTGFGQSSLLVIGKFPEAVGIIGFWLRKWLARPAALIEYK